MTPAKIVKSAHRRAGRPLPLKVFARQQILRGTSAAPAAAAWLQGLGTASFAGRLSTRTDAQRNDNTALLGHLPAKAGKPISFDRLYCRSKWSVQRLNDALGRLVCLGYIEETEGTYSRIRSAPSCKARKAAK